MQNKTTLLIGIIFILLGILFLGPAIGLFSLAKMWPAIILLVGLGLFMLFLLIPKTAGLLIPVTILVISSILFFYCTFSGNWNKMAVMWPIFPFSVAVGLYLMYFAEKKNRGLLLAATILLALSVIAIFVINYIKLIIPIIFIAAGLYFVFKSLSEKKSEKTS